LLNKKGVDWGSVAKIILVIIALLLLYNVIVYGYTSFITQSGSKEACKNWVNLQSTSVLKEARSLKSSCVTTEETIKDKDIKTKNDIYEILANNMYDCWDMYGRGEQDFYSYLFTESGANYCRICSEIKTSSDLEQNKRKVNIDDFEIYLTNTHIPSSRETYAEFLTKVDNAQINFGSGSLTLDPQKSLYTMFVVSKKAQNPNFFNEKTAVPSVMQFGIDLGGCTAVGEVGFLLGSLAGPVVGGIAGVGGCILGIVGGEVVSSHVGNNYFFPSVLLVNSDINQIRNSCGNLYYKPIKE